MPEEPMPEVTEEMLEALEEAEQERLEEAEDDRLQRAQEFQEGYPPPTDDEKHNQFTFLNKAAFESENTIRTTYLDKEELGRPLFSVRFLLDMEDVAKHYLDPIAEHLKGTNTISTYFLRKAQNISDSGQSKEGFMANLAAKKIIDTTRRKLSEASLKNLKQRQRRR